MPTVDPEIAIALVRHQKSRIEISAQYLIAVQARLPPRSVPNQFPTTNPSPVPVQVAPLKSPT